MKIAWLADTHLNLATYGDAEKDGIAFRSKDMMRSFEWAVTSIISAKVNAVFHLGDIYDDPHPSNNVREFFNSQIDRLLKAGIQVHILVGNHDACKENHALQPLQGLNLTNLFIYYKPTTVKLSDGSVVLVLPHTEAIERQEISLRASFLKANADWVDEISSARRNNHKVFFAGHIPVFGARQNNGHCEEDPDTLRIADLESTQADYAFLGDFHGFQVLKTETKLRAMYSGSLENTDFGDLPSMKGFLIYSTDPIAEGQDFGVENLRFVQNPNMRKMIVIKSSNVQEIEEWTQKEKDILKDAIIKISFSGNEKECFEFDAAQRDLIKKLENEAGVKLVRCEKKMLDEEQDARLQALQVELDKVDEVEMNDISEIVQLAMLKENQTLDAVEQSEINKLAQDIVKTVREAQTV